MTRPRTAAKAADSNHAPMPKVDKSIVRFKHGRKTDGKLTRKTLVVLSVFFALGMYAVLGGFPQGEGMHVDTTSLRQSIRQFVDAQPARRAAQTPAIPQTTDKPAQHPALAGVVTDHVTLRQYPSTAAQTVLVLEPGDEVELIGQQKGWVQARWSLQEGWLPADAVFSKEELVR